VSNLPSNLENLPFHKAQMAVQGNFVGQPTGLRPIWSTTATKIEKGTENFYRAKCLTPHRTIMKLHPCIKLCCSMNHYWENKIDNANYQSRYFLALDNIGITIYSSRILNIENALSSTKNSLVLSQISRIQ